MQLNISRDEENTGDEALSISLPSQDFKRMCKINELIEEQLKRLVNLMTARQQLVYIYILSFAETQVIRSEKRFQFGE